MTGTMPESSGRPVLNVVGELAALGPLRRDLLPLYGRWINDLASARNLGSHRPYTAEEEEDWYSSAIKDEGRAMFTLYERGSLRPIGTTSLFGIDHRNRRAEFGIYIGEPECRGKGYGTEAARLTLDYAFTALGLHNVMLRVFEYNLAGIRAYEKAGFKEYGRRRQAYLMGGRMWDDVHMDCLSTEFESPVLASAFAPDPRR